MNYATDPLTALASASLDCLVEALNDDGRPVCRAALYHGDTLPPADDCDCYCGVGVSGQAWVRIVEIRPAPGQPVPSVCGGGSLRQALLELGVYRCVSVPDEDGTPPSGTDQTADALAAYADANVLLAVVDCCPYLIDHNSSLTGWEPNGPEGGCGGSTVTAIVDL